MIKHVGIYVFNLELMENFYHAVFDMDFICSNQEFMHPLMEELLEYKESKVKISKLITEYGKRNGIGDMIELIAIENFVNKDRLKNAKIWENFHVAFEVQDVKKTVEKIIAYGGTQKTKIYQMENGNLCCFCVDPEKNWLELIGKA